MACKMRIAANTPLEEGERCNYDAEETNAHKVCCVVGANFISEPMLAAAMTCTAQPQSTEATPATRPRVLASIITCYKHPYHKIRF